MPNTILIVDDMASVRQLLDEYLTEQGFRVLKAVNGLDALNVANQEAPDLILLDLMMPQMDGYQFLREYRLEHRTPIIVITAREEETDAVMGLELGADDYIVKPFRMKEMLARIRAVLRRGGNLSARPELLRAGEITLDQTAHRVTVRGTLIQLTPIEFDLLAVLMRSPGQVFTRMQMVDHLTDSGFNGLEKTLNVHIWNLRKKIETDPEMPQYIETVFGVGYRLKRPN